MKIVEINEKEYKDFFDKSSAKPYLCALKAATRNQPKIQVKINPINQ